MLRRFCSTRSILKTTERCSTFLRKNNSLVRGFSNSAFDDEEFNSRINGPLFKVEDIIANRPCETPINMQASISEAITHLYEIKSTSSLVIDDNNDLAGLFTSTDIIKYMHLSGVKSRLGKERSLTDSIADMMTPREKLIHCSPSDSLDRCREMMFQLKLQHLPVIDNGEFLGIISLEDLLNASLSLSDISGKKGYIHNVSGRKGVPIGIQRRKDPMQCSRQNLALDVEVGAYNLPHPFKSLTSVAANKASYAGKPLCVDPECSEDAFSVLKVKGKSLDQVYMMVADGVGSWRDYGVDPRNFSKRLVKNAIDVIMADEMQRTFVSDPEDADMDRGLGFGGQNPIHPLDVMMDSWNMTTSIEHVVGSSTFCVCTVDNALNQLIYSNIGDCGLMVLRRIDSETAGYMRDRHLPKHLRTSDLKIAYTSQQQLKSFNLPYQLGFSNHPSFPNNFDSPNDADTASIPVLPGDIIILATDGLFDNLDLPEIVKEVSEWEKKWFSANSTALLNHSESCKDEVQDLAITLVNKAREVSLDDSRDSPFALLAKENDIMWGGGMPDDTTVIVGRVVVKK